MYDFNLFFEYYFEVECCVWDLLVFYDLFCWGLDWMKRFVEVV